MLSMKKIAINRAHVRVGNIHIQTQVVVNHFSRYIKKQRNEEECIIKSCSNAEDRWNKSRLFCNATHTLTQTHTHTCNESFLLWILCFPYIFGSRSTSIVKQVRQGKIIQTHSHKHSCVEEGNKVKKQKKANIYI